MTDATDHRPQLHRALDQAARVVEGVSPDQLRSPTPCTEFDVTALLGHLVGVGRRLASIGRGEPQGPQLQAVTDVAADEWHDAFDQARREAQAEWQKDEVLDRKVELPFGTFPGAVVADIYVVELVTHTWDLAAATGQRAALDSDLAEFSLPIAQGMVPAEGRSEVPFEAVVAVPDDAPPFDRLAAYLGRQP